MIESISVVVLTRDEEPNIGRTLDALRLFPEIIVLDSFSSDRTAETAKGFPNVRFFERSFDCHADQWNHGISLATRPWILALDADYLVTEALREELDALAPAELVSGYAVDFLYTSLGKVLRGNLYPRSTVLFRRDRGSYVQDGHTQRLRLEGRVEVLKGKIIHDDRKSLGRWLVNQSGYMSLEAGKLESAPGRDLPWADRLRKMKVIAPFAVLAYTLFRQGLIFDGWPGVYYCLQRFTAELILSMKLVEAGVLSASRSSPQHKDRRLS